MDSCSHLFQLVFTVLVLTTCWWTTASGLNITLNLTQLNSSQGSENVVIGSDVYVFCLNEQNSYSVYVTEDQSKAESCETTPSNSYKLIGSCQNSPLTIRILTTSISFGDIQSYEVGSQYYFTVFVNNGLSITSNQPCLDGYKFSFGTVAAPVDMLSSSAPLMPSSSSVMNPVSSSVIMYNNTTNPMVSAVSTSYQPSNPYTDSSSYRSTSDNGVHRPRTTSTTDNRQTITSTSRGGGRRVTTMMTVDISPMIGRTSTSNESVATYAGIGAGAIVFIIIVIVLVVLLVVVAVIVSRKKNRNRVNSAIYDDANKSEKNNTLKKIMPHDDVEYAVVNDDYSNTGDSMYQLTVDANTTSISGIPLTTFNNNGNGSVSPVFSSNEEQSLRSTSSMDPLLTSSPPNSPLRSNVSPALDSIPEKTDLEGSNNEHPYSNLESEDIKKDTKFIDDQLTSF